MPDPQQSLGVIWVPKSAKSFGFLTVFFLYPRGFILHCCQYTGMWQHIGGKMPTFYIAYKIKYLLNIFCSDCCLETILTEHQHTLIIKPFFIKVNFYQFCSRKYMAMFFYKGSKMIYKQGICDVRITQHFQSTAWGVHRYVNENFFRKADMQSVNLSVHNNLM